MNAFVEVLRDLRHTRRACLVNHLALLGCDVGPPRWPNWLADPEVVIAHHRAAGSDDATIPQEIGSWVLDHDNLLSIARLTAIAPDKEEAWGTVVAELRHDARSWRGRKLDLHAPQVTRLRLRGLLGAGSRAEICLALAASTDVLSGSAIAVHTGFRRQQINRELRTMHATGWVQMRVNGKSNEYRPSPSIRDLVGPLPANAGIRWPERVGALGQLISVVDDIVQSEESRGSLIDAFDRLDRGLGTIAAFWEPSQRGSLDERIIGTVRERLDVIRADW